VRFSTQISGIFLGLPQENPPKSQFSEVFWDLPQKSGMIHEKSQITPPKKIIPKNSTFFGLEKNTSQKIGIYPKIFPRFWDESQSAPDFWDFLG